LRVRVLVAFAAAFVAGAVVIFTAASLAGLAAGVALIPSTWRVLIAATVFAALAVIDVVSIRKRRYCPIGWRRQTPRRIGDRGLGPTVSAAVWGFDTGIIVTTFRVAAITWGALAMAALGLAPWWIGLGYGLGFAIPIMVMLVAQNPDSESLQRLLGKRSILQFASAVALVLGSVLIFA
jgi:hypothetical protein